MYMKVTSRRVCLTHPRDIQTVQLSADRQDAQVPSFAAPVVGLLGGKNYLHVLTALISTRGCPMQI